MSEKTGGKNFGFSGHKKWVMFPGRWQPLHKGHLAIMQPYLDKGQNLWIGIRDTPVSQSDPYTIEQRMEMIRRAFGPLYGDRVIATPIPDIAGIAYGRGVGYFVEEATVSPEIAEISATGVRAGRDKRVNEDVKSYVGLLESTLWFTGLPCSGKTTIADRLQLELDNLPGYKTYKLDGDVVRGPGSLNENLGFSDEDRFENLRRIAHVAKMFNDSKTTVLASFVSPSENQREMIENIVGPEKFKLIYVDCPLQVCEARDVKGMYAKARAGQIPGFTGVSAPFDVPKNPAVVVKTNERTLEECVEQIISELGIRG